jgi:hypothetical protein
MVWISLACLIWWDHPNIFNHLSFPYIKRDFSWKRLRLIQERLILNRLRFIQARLILNRLRLIQARLILNRLRIG